MTAARSDRSAALVGLTPGVVTKVQSAAQIFSRMLAKRGDNSGNSRVCKRWVNF